MALASGSDYATRSRRCHKTWSNPRITTQTAAIERLSLRARVQSGLRLRHKPLLKIHIVVAFVHQRGDQGVDLAFLKLLVDSD